MIRFFHKYQLWIETALRVVLYLLILFITASDLEGIHRWVIFGLYIFLIGSIFVTYIVNNLATKSFKISKQEVWLFVGLLGLVSAISFFALRDYPFVGVHDELRDAGLDALRVVSGELRNFFAYGEYIGFGNIIPVFSSFFYRIFGASVYTYRVPAAFMSILDVGLLYILLRQIINKRYIALIGSLAYAALALHLFYGRTELVVIFDSFWTTSMLLVFYIWFQKRRTIDFIFLGTVLGVAANFHSAVRIVAIIVFALACAIEVKRVLFGKVKMSLGIFGLILYCFIGFGPTVLYSSSSNFFQSNKIDSGTFTTKQSLLSVEVFDKLKQNYAKSLMVWFYEPAHSHYQGTVPLLPPLFGLLFISGLGYAFFVAKKPFVYILLGFIFLLPLTNSAITDSLNADHRLMPLLPLGAIFVAVGLQGITELFSKSLIKYVIIGIFVCNIGFQLFHFFYFQSANIGYKVKDYLSMHTVYLLQSLSNVPNVVNPMSPDSSVRENVCLQVSTANAINLDLLHYKEQYQYFLPNTTLTVIGDSSLPDNRVNAYKGSCPTNFGQLQQKKVIRCPNKNQYLCPIDYKEDITIYY